LQVEPRPYPNIGSTYSYHVSFKNGTEQTLANIAPAVSDEENKFCNTYCRSASYTLLVVIGEALQRWHTDLSTDDIIREFLKVVLAGLAGSPSLVYCTLLVI
jgi:hypothetical protein